MTEFELVTRQQSRLNDAVCLDLEDGSILTGTLAQWGKSLIGVRPDEQAREQGWSRKIETVPQGRVVSISQPPVATAVESSPDGGGADAEASGEVAEERPLEEESQEEAEPVADDLGEEPQLDPAEQDAAADDGEDTAPSEGELDSETEAPDPAPRAEEADDEGEQGEADPENAAPTQGGAKSEAASSEPAEPAWVQIGNKRARLGERIPEVEFSGEVAVYRIAPPSWQGVRDIAVFLGGTCIGLIVYSHQKGAYRAFCKARGRACFATRSELGEAVRAIYTEDRGRRT
ncbi:hypothetical protein IL38_23675 [Actinopolyspora erythraea]|uniref:Uncharacterized protein n=1 Tax=Actinopolyspora erythraea TaxID=414996 RepID=A0ABR4WY52_9ACTN|nr:hypothetical protein [Actinopolyspora erythraea]KGI79313.1 hypothetical protein IL38_23675 [Actinopolyspora erythraea]